MTTQEILLELQAMGSDAIKRIFQNHGAPEPLFGVRVQDLKKLQKKLKKNYALALELYNTGNSDAQYLAGLIADEKRMSRQDLQHWADTAPWHMHSEYTVAWVAAESPHGFALALEWIDADKELLQIAGWATLASVVSIQKDEQLDLEKLSELLHRVECRIHTAPNYVRYTMNGFVIALGSYVAPLTSEALRVAKAIGKVSVHMGNTACKVPEAPLYIQKISDKGRVGKKKKMARC